MRSLKRRGNIKITDELDLDIGKIKDADIETSYKYLGIAYYKTCRTNKKRSNAK